LFGEGRWKEGGGEGGEGGGGGGGTEPLLLRKKSYMDELLCFNKHLLKAGVAVNPSNSFNHLLIHSQIERTGRISFSIYTGHIIERNFPFGKRLGAL